MLTYYDYYRALTFGLGNAVVAGVTVISIMFAITSIVKKVKSRARKKYFDSEGIAKFEEKLKKRDEVTKNVNFLKQRIFEDTVIKTDVMDIVVNEGFEDEFGEMVTRVKDEYTQRQARAFLSCALNLMAHSYGDLEEVRQVATEMIEKELDY